MHLNKDNHLTELWFLDPKKSWGNSLLLYLKRLYQVILIRYVMPLHLLNYRYFVEHPNLQVHGLQHHLQSWYILGERQMSLPQNFHL